MKGLRLGRFALSSCAAAVFLTACGGSQPPIGALGARQQSRAIATHAEHGASWMLPEAKSEDLLYALGVGRIEILSYPAGKQAGQITQDLGGYVCSDPSSGNVFVTSDSETYEFAHGGTKPIATFNVPSGSDVFNGCSVDAATGDLAITNIASSPYTGVIVYHHAQGQPVVYTDTNANYFTYCGYDAAGNLFVDGVSKSNAALLDELPKGSDTLREISVNQTFGIGPVQWDGTYITTENPSPPMIYRLAVTGSTATAVGTTRIRQTKSKNEPDALTWIQGTTVIAADGKKNKHLAYWNYPAGGKPTKVLNNLAKGKKDGFGAVTVSVAPTQ